MVTTQQQQRLHTLTAFFDTRQEAARAIEELVAAGVGRTEIELLPGERAAAYTRPPGQRSYDHRRDEGGFWASLKHLFLPHEDRYAYAEGMSRGGVVLSVRVDEGELERAARILESHGSIDMDQREAAWRREGWTGYGAAPGASRAGAEPGGTAQAPTAGGTAAGHGGEEVIPIAEEELRVGKRRVVTGRVRVRVYVVEVPVTAQVALRDETVRVERHPVGRALTPEEAARLLQERTVEVEERDEEPVVEKVAVVKEELVIRKEAEERVETVTGRVRRTEVEVENDPAGTVGGTARTGRNPR